MSDDKVEGGKDSVNITRAVGGKAAETVTQTKFVMQAKSQILEGIAAMAPLLESLPIGVDVSTTNTGSNEPKNQYWEKTVEWLFVRNHFPGKALVAPLASTAEEAADAILRFENIHSWCLIEFKKDGDCFGEERVKYPAFGYAKWEKLYKSDIEKKIKRDKKGNISEDDAKLVTSELADLFKKAQISFNDLVEFWEKPLVGADTKPPHIFIYGKFGKSPESVELENLNDALKRIEAILEGFAISTDVELLRTWIRKNSVDLNTDDTFRILGKQYWGPWCEGLKFKPKVPVGVEIEINDLNSIGWPFEKFKSYVTAVIAAKRGGDAGGRGDATDDRENWDFGTVLGMTADGRVATLSTYDFAVDSAIVPPKNNQTNSISASYAVLETTKPGSGKTHSR